MKNKIYGLIFIGLGVATALVSGDGTFLLFSLIIGVNLFFSKEKVMG